jgi:hypothetical protein
MARDASRPDALRRQRRAGTVKDAEGTASGGSRRRPFLRVPCTVALTLSTELGSQLQEDSFYRIHIGGLNSLFESTVCIESAGPFMREFPSRAGPFMRISPSLSGTVYAWISPAAI